MQKECYWLKRSHFIFPSTEQGHLLHFTLDVTFTNLVLKHCGWSEYATRITILGHANLITCLTSFFGKRSCQTQKKRRKKLTLVSYGRKWFGNFLSDSKKKKVLDLRIFIVRVIQSTSGVFINAAVEPHVWGCISPTLKVTGINWFWLILFS